MTPQQKVIALVGLAAIGIAALFAPYKYTAANDTARIINGTGDDPTYWTEGYVHAPLWSPPAFTDFGVKGNRYDLTDSARVGFYRVRTITLDAGRLGLTWAAIAAVTAVVMIVVAPERRVSSGRRSGAGNAA